MNSAALHHNSPLITWTTEFPSTRDLFATGNREWSWSGAVRFLTAPSKRPQSTAFFQVVTGSGAIADVREIEDELCIAGNTVATFDACSSAYRPGAVRRQVGEMWDGQFAAASVADFTKANTGLPLRDLILESNANLGQQLEGAGFDLRDAGLLPGVSGAAAQFNSEDVDLCQWGDGIIVVKLIDRRLFAFENQSFREDCLERSTAKEILARVGNRKAMWDEFAPLLQQFRSEVVNNPDSPRGYGNLNGQSGVHHFLRSQRIPRSQISWILIATDGLVPFEQMENPTTLARYVEGGIESGGLPALYRAGKTSEVHAPKDQPFTASSEKTAVWITF